MVTLHIIPCSSCGKEVERYIYCSGACKVRGKREKDKGDSKRVKLDETPKEETSEVGKWVTSKIDGKRYKIE